MKSKKKILIIFPYWDATYRNKNIGKFLSLIDSDQIDLYIYCSKSSGDKDIGEFLPHANLLNFRPEVERGIWNRFISLLYFMTVLIRLRNFYVFWTYAGYIENFLLAILNVPFVLKSDSTLEIANSNDTLFRKFRSWMFFTYIGKKAKLILVETKKLQKQSEEIYDQSKVLYFPNGVNIKAYNNFVDTKKNYISPKKKGIFLCTGRMLPSKGIDLAIKSFSFIAEESSWELHFVGTQEDKTYLDQCKKLVKENHLEARVFFHGPCFGNDLFKWYQEADVFIMPSRNEGLANRLPEAMIFGNPVVAYDVGYTSALVSNASGALIKKNDFKFFAEEMLRFEKNTELRNKVSLHNINHVKKNFNDDLIFESLFDKSNKVGVEIKASQK